MGESSGLPREGLANGKPAGAWDRGQALFHKKWGKLLG